jgi:magnesium transporter
MSDDSTTVLTYATTRVPQAHPDDTMADILHQLGHGGPYDSMTDVAVIETGRLIGMIAIEQLFAAPLDTPASVIMNHNPPVIGPGVDRKSAAAKATSHDDCSVGVVDINGTFLGLIPPHRILGVLLEERREDMAV